VKKDAPVVVDGVSYLDIDDDKDPELS
jgi:hypothetical protein